MGNNHTGDPGSVTKFPSRGVAAQVVFQMRFTARPHPERGERSVGLVASSRGTTHHDECDVDCCVVRQLHGFMHKVSSMLAAESEEREMGRRSFALAAVSATLTLATGSVMADGIFNDSYSQSMSFSGNAGLEQTSMNMTFDGTHYWASSGGSPGGIRLAQFDINGNLVNTYEPGVDFRSVFTVNGMGGTVYGRGFGDSAVLRMDSPGVFNPFVTLSGGSLNEQSQVEFGAGGNEFIAHNAGNIDRWSLGGAYLGSVSLNGFGTMFNEDTYPANRGVVYAGGYYLTFSDQHLSAWDASGNRVGTTELIGSGTSFDSEFSLSWANGKIWIIDEANGMWRGYQIDAIPAPGALALFGVGGLLFRRARRRA